MIARRPTRLILHLQGTFSKLILLDALMRMSVKQPLSKRLIARYVSQYTTGEEFTDALSFAYFKTGDCASAAVYYGALLRQRGVKAYIILCQFWDSSKQANRFHVILYVPKWDLLVDPTFILFNNVPKRRTVWKPRPVERAAITRQIRAIQAGL